ncbi:MAG: hypothetical protein ACPGVC_11100 [Salibacteraceae bacterium]
MIKYFPILLMFLFVLGCKKGQDGLINTSHSIECKVQDYFSGSPIEDAIFSFDVASGGGGWSGTIERNKYLSWSDENGVFILDDLGNDVESTFYPNFAYHSLDMDTLMPEYRYFINGFHSDSLWIVKGVNTTLRLKPSGVTYFRHPVLQNAQFAIDTIVVRVHHQIDTVTFSKTVSSEFYLIPSKQQDIELEYIENGVSTQKDFQHYIPYAFEIDSFGGTRRCDFRVNIPE